MLTSEQKNQLIDNRTREYEVKIFNLEMDRAALAAAGDDAQVENIDKRIEALRKAIQAVGEMREYI